MILPTLVHSLVASLTNTLKREASERVSVDDNSKILKRIIIIDQMEDEVQESMDQIDQLIAESQSGVNTDNPKVKRLENHICSDMLSVYEITQVIGYRAVTIENTGIYYCTIEHLSDLETEKLTAIGLAVLELQQKKCPLLIQRKVTPWSSEVEIVNPNHMILPQRMNIKLS